MTGREDHMQFPVIINCRDRVEPLRELVAWLERAGHRRIVLLDNASAYRPLLDYYAETPHSVVRLKRNLGHRAPWRSGLVRRLARGGPYVVTDPDVVPDEACPLDAVGHFHEALGKFEHVVKVGFGLRTDDLPTSFRHHQEVQDWEAQFWRREVAPGFFDASIDTTFAVYRGRGRFRLEPALRTGPPYVARHTPWYADSERPSEEDVFYRAHLRGDVSSWGDDVLPGDLQRKIAEVAAGRDPTPTPLHIGLLTSARRLVRRGS